MNIVSHELIRIPILYDVAQSSWFLSKKIMRSFRRLELVASKSLSLWRAAGNNLLSLDL